MSPKENFHCFVPTLEMTRLSISVKGLVISLPNMATTGRNLSVFQLRSTCDAWHHTWLAAQGDDGVASALLSHSLSVGNASIGISLLLCQPLTSTESRT